LVLIKSPNCLGHFDVVKLLQHCESIVMFSFVYGRLHSFDSE
jgi:hypothetical protein